MAGPSLSGPLTGWTSSTLAPRAAAVVAAAPLAVRARSPVVNRPEFVGQFGSPTPQTLEKMRKAYEKQVKRAEALEVEARATGDPVKLRHAYDLAVGAAGMKNWSPGQTGQPVESLIAAKAFRDRNPTIESLLSSHGKELLNNPLPPAETLDRLRGGERQGEPIGGGAVLAPGPTYGTYGNDVVFGPDQGAPGQPLRAQSVGGPDAYNLSASDFGSSGGPDPRLAAKPQTPLEQLLSSIYPDAVGSAPGGDPRAAGAQPSVINNILANLGTNSGQATSGYVPAPALIGPAPAIGAQIASTIPGAPPFLAGAINNLGGQSGFVPAPVAVRPGFDPLIGISAISAEQRIQEAERLKAKAAADAAWFAQLQAQQRAQQQQDQIARQQTGLSASGWQSPTFKPTGWVQNFPSY